MKDNRPGDNESSFMRTGRFCCINGVWYFKIRGGEQKGPFPNRKSMETALEEYVQQVSVKAQPLD